MILVKIRECIYDDSPNEMIPHSTNLPLHCGPGATTRQHMPLWCIKERRRMMRGYAWLPFISSARDERCALQHGAATHTAGQRRPQGIHGLTTPRAMTERPPSIRSSAQSREPVDGIWDPLYLAARDVWLQLGRVWCAAPAVASLAVPRGDCSRLDGFPFFP